MAHGILSSGSVWDDVWVPELDALGLPRSNNLNMGNLDSIASNASKIAAEVADGAQRWGVDKVVLVGHSKGGLDSDTTWSKTMVPSSWCRLVRRMPVHL